MHPSERPPKYPAAYAPAARDRTLTVRLAALPRRAARRIFGPELVNQYLPALRARGRTVPYEPKSTWTARYEDAVRAGALADATTIKDGANPLRVRYHYNAVENAILEHALAYGFPERPSVLDVGAGAGHWLDFYRDVLGAQDVVGVEISASAAAALAAAYADDPVVTVTEGDVADSAFDLGRRFDVVNAVDVLFHIVDDGAWRRAVGTLGRHLAPEGRLVVAEHVGLASHAAGFSGPDGGAVEVTKRVRSARAWRSCAHAAGLRVLDTRRIRKRRTEPTPANRLIVLGRSPSSDPT
jgi:SAM-dependent methyltransferase